MSEMEKTPYVQQREADRRRFRTHRQLFRESKRTDKREQRQVKQRERLNRLFRGNVPKPAKMLDEEIGHPRTAEAPAFNV